MIERWELVAIDAALLGYEITLRRVGRVLEEVEQTSPIARILYLAYDRQELALVPQDAEVILCQRSGAAEAIMELYRSRGAVGNTAQPAPGKHILWLRERRTPFISYFTPPKGVVCRRFAKLAIGNGCPYDCVYCYLQFTLRMQPMVSLFCNLEKLEKELPRWGRKGAASTGRLLLNAGELADAVEPFPWLVGRAIGMAAPYTNLGVLLVTKSARLPEVPGLGPWVTAAVSLTTDQAAALFEPGAPPPEERLRALGQAIRRAGVRARVRLDPIIPWGNWQEDYVALVERMAEELEEIDLVTLGQLRFAPGLLPRVMRRSWPLAELLSGAVLEGGKLRMPQEERMKIYRFIGELLGEQGIPWGVCKETPQVVEALKSHAGFEPQRCNCIW